MMPSFRDSVPRVGLTVRTDCFVRSTGNEPAFKMAARFFASLSVKLPVICPRPAVMGDCTTGLEMMLWSNAMAIWFCGGCALTASRVAVANAAVPSPSKTKSMTHSATDWLEPDSDAVALVMLGPGVTTGAGGQWGFFLFGGR